MSDYAAPIADMRFVLNEIVGLGEIAGLPGYEEATADTIDAVLEVLEECRDRLAELGFRGEVVSAQSNREQQIEDFLCGRIEVLFSMAILAEGFGPAKISNAGLSRGSPTSFL